MIIFVETTQMFKGLKFVSGFALCAMDLMKKNIQVVITNELPSICTW
jgi:hypothetical protein